MRRFWHRKHAAPLLVLLAIAAGSLCSLEIWREHAVGAVDFYRSFDAIKHIGANCDGAIGKWRDGDTFDAVRARPHAFEPLPLPYRAFAKRLIVPEHGYLYSRCVLDLSDADTERFAKIFLGRIFGKSAVYLGGRLRLMQSDEGHAEFFLLPEDRRPEVTLEIIAYDDTASGLPGLATLVPPMQMRTRADLAAVQRTLNAINVEVPVFRIGYASALMLFFAIAWLVGIRYPDVGWMVVVTSMLVLSAWSSFSPFGIQSPLINHELALTAFGLYLALGGFAVAFLRQPHDHAKHALIYLVVLGAATALVMSLDRRIVLEYYLETRVVYSIGALVLAAAGYLALSRRGTLPLARQRRVRALAAVCIAGSVSYVVQAILIETRGIDIEFIVNYGIVTTFAGLLISDLVTFHNNYFTERTERKKAESKSRIFERSLELGESVQKLLLPPEMAGEIGPYRYLMHHSSYERMTGDWLYRTDLPNARVALWQGDVVGKGPASALGVTAIMAAMAEHAAQQLPPAASLGRIDATLKTLFKQHINSTASAVVLSNDGTAELFNCGAVGWFLWRAGQLRHLPLRGTLLGMEGEPEPGKAPIDLLPGDLLFTFSDGVLEGGKALAILKRRLEKTVALGALKDLVEILLETGQEFSLPDDQTITIVQRTAS